MSEQKTVFNKLWKSNNTELASQKVELALNDDIAKAYKQAIDARKSAADVYFNAKKVIDAAVAEMKNLKAINQSALDTFGKFDALVKELGIPYPQEQANQKQNIQDGLKGTFASYTKSLESVKL